MKLASIFALTLLAALPALAQSDTTWVSASGSDFNPCTFSQPCRTFNHARVLTNSNGIVKAINAADYGAVAVDQPIVIDGNGVASITANLFGTGQSAGRNTGTTRLEFVEFELK
jgi:hypothetical protein